MQPPRSQQPLDRASWLQRRRSGIGGSDIGAILGLNPYRGPLEVWADKRGLIEQPERDQEELENLEMGAVMEPVVAQVYEKRSVEFYGTQVRVIETGFEVLQHPKHEWWIGTRDRVIEGHPSGYDTLEAKNTDKRHLGEWEAGGPEYYLAQLQWYIGATDSPGGVLAAVIGGNRFRKIESPRNDRLLEEMGFLAEEFWIEYVLADREPPADGLKSTRAVLKQLHPRDTGMTVILPGEMEDDIYALEQAKADIKEAEGREIVLTNKLCQALGDATYGVAGTKRVSWKWQSRKAEYCPCGCGTKVREEGETRTFLIRKTRQED